MNITATISHEYALVVDYPSYPSESCLTEWEKSGLCGALKVDEDTNCFIAFDSSGGGGEAGEAVNYMSNRHGGQDKRGDTLEGSIQTNSYLLWKPKVTSLFFSMNLKSSKTISELPANNTIIEVENAKF